MPPVTFSDRFQAVCGFDWPGWPRTLIWTITVLFLAWLCARDVALLVNQHKDQNAATQIDVVIGNKTLRRPELALCLPYYSGAFINVANWIRRHSGLILQGILPSTEGCIECEAMQNHSWAFWANLTFRRELMLDHKGYLAAILVKKIIEEDAFDLLILNENEEGFRWNQPLLDAVWYYTACVYARDHLFVGNGRAWIGDCRVFDFSIIGPISNAKLDQFLNVTSNGIDFYLRTQISSSEPFRINPPIQTRHGFTPFIHKFCFRMLENSTGEQYPFYTNLRETPPNLPPWKMSNRMSRLEIYDLTQANTLHDSDQALFKTDKIELRNLSWHVVELSYTIENMVMEKRSGSNCEPDRIPFDCIVKRQFQHAVQICNCIPFAFRYLQPDTIDLPYCTSEMYDSCTRKIGLEKELDLFDTHQEKCNRKCQYIFYKWKWNHRAVESDSYVFHVYLRSIDRPFVLISLVHKTTFEQFLAQLGGVFGLYLGFSGLTACALIVFIIDIMKRWKNKKPRDEEDNGNRERDSSAGWRLFWMTRMVQMAQKKRNNENEEEEKLNGNVEREIEELKEEIAETNRRLDYTLEEIKELKLNVKKVLDIFLKEPGPSVRDVDSCRSMPANL